MFPVVFTVPLGAISLPELAFIAAVPFVFYVVLPFIDAVQQRRRARQQAERRRQQEQTKRTIASHAWAPDVHVQDGSNDLIRSCLRCEAEMRTTICGQEKFCLGGAVSAPTPCRVVIQP